MKIALILGFVAILAGGTWWWRTRSTGPALTGAAAICAKDFAELPNDHVTKRCQCVVEALEKTIDGREVLGLITLNGHFLKTIESAASHASVLDAMNACGQ